MSYVMLQTQDYNFYCAVKEYTCQDDFNLERKEILKVFEKNNMIDTLQSIELYFGSKFHSLKDIPIDRRKTILENLINSRLQKTAKTYEDLYDDLLNPISYLNDLGMDIPESFRICAKYTLISNLIEELQQITTYTDKHKLQKCHKIKELTDKFHIKLNNSKAKEILSSNLINLLTKLRNQTTIKNTQELLGFFELLEKLQIETLIS